MVRQFDDKKLNLAKADGIAPKSEPVSEFGACMGYSPDVPGSYEFLIKNGLILARKVVHVVSVHSPFGWKPRIAPSVDSSSFIGVQGDVQDDPLAPEANSSVAVVMEDDVVVPLVDMPISDMVVESPAGDVAISAAPPCDPYFSGAEL